MGGDDEVRLVDLLAVRIACYYDPGRTIGVEGYIDALPELAREEYCKRLFDEADAEERRRVYEEWEMYGGPARADGLASNAAWLLATQVIRKKAYGED